MTPTALAALNGRPHAFDWAPPLFVHVDADQVALWRDAGYVALSGSVGTTGRIAMLFAPEQAP